MPRYHVYIREVFTIDAKDADAAWNMADRLASGAEQREPDEKMIDEVLNEQFEPAL